MNIHKSSKLKIKFINFWFKLGRFNDRFEKHKGLTDEQLRDTLGQSTDIDETAFDHMLNLHNRKRCNHCDGFGFTATDYRESNAR